MYLFSLPAPVGFQPNGEPQRGGYSNTLKSFFIGGPYMRAFLHEVKLHGPVLLSRGPFTFVFQLTTVQKLYWLMCVLMIHAECETHALPWPHCRFMISRLPCYYRSLVSMLLLLCVILFSDAEAIFCCRSFIHLCFVMSF